MSSVDSIFDMKDYKSRKEINTYLTKLKVLFVYGNRDDEERQIILDKIKSLRVYKNTYFPKKSVFNRIFRSLTI
jgi:hypothetical protein